MFNLIQGQVNQVHDLLFTIYIKVSKAKANSRIYFLLNFQGFSVLSFI